MVETQRLVGRMQVATSMAVTRAAHLGDWHLGCTRDFGAQDNVAIVIRNYLADTASLHGPEATTHDTE